MKYDPLIAYWAHMLDEAMKEKGAGDTEKYKALVNMEKPCISYSNEDPSPEAILNSNNPIDIMHPLRTVQTAFKCPAETPAEYTVPNGALKAVLGKNITCETNKIFLYKNGLAASPLNESMEFLEALEKLEYTIADMEDYAAVKNSVEAAARADASDNYEGFRRDNHRIGKAAIARLGDKVSRHKAEQEQKNADRTKSKIVQNAVNAKIQDLVGSRNSKLLGSGFSKTALNAMLNSKSLVIDEKSLYMAADNPNYAIPAGNQTMLYWYPTLLDLCRLLKSDTLLPLQTLKNVNDRDNLFNVRPETGNPIYESFFTVDDGKKAYKEIEFIKHKIGTGNTPFRFFQTSKPHRWAQIRAVSPGEDLGEIFCKAKNIESFEGKDPIDIIVFRNGICIIYRATGENVPVSAPEAASRNPNDPTSNILKGYTPITAMFIAPELLVFLLGNAEKQKITWTTPAETGGIPVSMLKTCIENIKRIQADNTNVYTRRSNTRRYIQ